MTGVQPRTKGERDAYVAGAADVFNDIERLGISAARAVWAPLFEERLAELEQETSS